jgi:hypothetical protein
MSLEPIFMPTDPSRERITVRPEPEARDEPRWKGSTQKATLGDGKQFTSDDFIDLINPLHHIPVVGHIYRAVTGDHISHEASIIGGSLFGGPAGMIASSVNALIEHEATSPALQPQQVAQSVPKTAPYELAQMIPRPIITPPSVTPPKPAPLGDEPYLLGVGDSYQSATEVPVKAPSLPTVPTNPEDQDKHDLILELFGSGLSAAHDDYRKMQALEYVSSANKGFSA